MPAVWVTVTFVNGPKKTGGKFGSIRTNECGFVSVPVAELHQFQKGQRYVIEIDEVDNGPGREPYRNFVRFANQPPAQQQAAPPPSVYRPPLTRQPSAPQPIARSLPPRPVQQPTQTTLPLPSPPQSFQQQNDDQARHIFVTGIVGRAMGSGKFIGPDILELTREAAQAYDVVFRGMELEQKTLDQTFDDPLPDPSQYGALPHDQGGDQDIRY